MLRVLMLSNGSFEVRFDYNGRKFGRIFRPDDSIYGALAECCNEARILIQVLNSGPRTVVRQWRQRQEVLDVER